jgi:glycosyltransferase involved in cell wall biosynthesis
MRIGTKLRFAPWPRKPLLWLRYRQVQRIEARLARKTPHVAFITARDRDIVIGPESPAIIIPNGVDHRYWKRRPEAQTAPHTIVFTGVMDYTPNEDAALHLIEDIAPLVRRAIPDLEVLIVGRDPSRRLREAARRSYGVDVTGFVEDMRPYYERATVCVAPLRYASGMQNKVLEALAMQLPVVATPVVAEGLRLNGDEPPVVTAPNPRAFAEAVVRLLKQPAERERLSWQGRRYVESHFCWRRSAEMLEQMFFNAVRASRMDVAPEHPPKRVGVGNR